MPARHLFCTLLLLILPFSAAPAAAEKRVALVIGNGAYANATHLINPSNDAADMAAILRSLGFEVIAATNVDKVTFDRKVREFGGALHHAHTALFFYAGHGMQVAGKNYAVPVDAKLDNAADLQVETVDIDRVMEVMESDDTRALGRRRPYRGRRRTRHADRLFDRAQQGRARRPGAQFAVHRRAAQIYRHARP